MFSKAVAKGAKFTRPVVTLTYCVDGQVRASVGSFVVVNKDGWFLTAGHMHKGWEEANTASAAVKVQQAQIAAINANPTLSKNAKKGELRRVGQPDSKAPIEHATWWSWNGVGFADVTLLDPADLMLGRLVPYDPTWVDEYPRFKDPSSPILQGTSLCRIGYPFPSVGATYDATKAQRFALTQVEMPLFPIEGILTRRINVSDNPAGYKNSFLETSSPGLKGQSGGAIIDVDGAVWGIQSQTRHLSLGFDPEVPDGKGGVTKQKEHQFLNVGWSAHPETVVGLLKEKGIAHTLAP